ncbi:conserved hypothetical protein [Leishmania mexicana MHOM/GT/2001/U1103]|uniref:Uncharacterized protein n=1 Tax=Leishmania mexicana (strain MHOM/GT/2001/U1103) TaxID=929439 RepID=E9ARQ6_LEIMU|nr:conserved hypothetical protein [Leishmania mexicana MHOM/GT/2001/U1103]CBZ25627.1 conserved hypothetical protein [Leishmania mexicana MHOM/GT/2001/U1103]
MRRAIGAVASKLSTQSAMYLRHMHTNGRALARATPRVSRRFYAGKASLPGRVGPPSQPPSAPRLQTPPGSSSRPSAPTSLNAFSKSVRSHLAAHPSPSSSADELWVVDRLFALLLHPAKDTYEASSTTALPPALEPLHPLLCVRVLQRLGYAVWECEAAAQACPTQHGTAARKKGWTVRHTYPSLASGNGAIVPSAESLSSSQSVASAIYANTERVAGAVLAPLMPLLGDGTAAHPPHSQVLPVLPLIVEWLCTLPIADSAVPLDRWLPWVVAIYTEDHHNRRPPSQSLLLPPLLNLLPHLLRKLSVYLADSTVAEQEAAQCSPNIFCEHGLASLFALSLAGSAGTDSERGECESRDDSAATGKATLSPVDLSSHQYSRPKLADVLWWHGEAPLLRLAGVRRALKQAGQTVPVASSAAAAKSLDTPATATSGELSTHLLHLQRDQELSRSHSERVPHVTVALGDDDVYRRFLLRLAALQNTSLVNAAASAPREILPALVSVRLTGAVALGATESSRGHAPASLSEDPDMILRFIQPLHEYVLLLQESSAQWSGTVGQTAAATADSTAGAPPVQLTFTGVAHVLMAVFGRLEELKQQSSCRGAAAVSPALRAQASLSAPAGNSVTTAFVLLPQKARIHALKSLCELLLRHVRAVQASKSASSTLPTGAAPDCVPWFVDVELFQQEATLRRLCGAARALVRVVMEERRRSLDEEGPEGSVLTASSVVAAQQHRASGGGPGTSTTSTSSAATPLTSTISFERILRSLAFRVVEPALWRLHEACTEAQTSVPVHVLTFEEWRLYLSVANAHEAGRGILAGRLASAAVEHVEQVYSPVMASAVSLFDCLGGRAGLRTAQQVLLHSGQQPVSALVEGIRLTALQCLLFDGLRSGGPFSSTAAASSNTREEAAGYMDWVLHHLSHAFFSVWQRTEPPPTLADLPSAANEAGEVAVADQQLLRRRLGLLALLLHARVLSARELLRRDPALLPGTTPSRPTMNANPTRTRRWVGDVPSSLDSLLHCMTKDSAALPISGDARDEWSLVLSAATLRVCVMPPLPAGCTALWELAEMLQDLGNGSTKAEETLEPPAAVTEWVWLGSPEALYEAVDASLLKDGGSDPAGGVSLRHGYYLLPWTTLAHSHQPWRVYDESGQARRAAKEWEAMLQSWLTGSSSIDGGKWIPSRRRQQPVVRLVSLREEVCFFTCMQQVSTLHLNADVRVVRGDVQREEREVAPTVRRVLTASQAARIAASSAAVGESAGWYDEEDYDGLD